MSIEIKDADGFLKSVEGQLEKAVERYEGQLAEAKSASNEVRDEVKALAEKYDAAAKELDMRVTGIEEKGSGFPMGDQAERPEPWGQKMIDSEAFKSFTEGSSQKARIEVKNTILGESGSPQDPDGVLIQADRLPGIVPGAFRQLNVLDFVPTGTTNSNAIEYVREIPAESSPAGFDNNAAERAEGTAKPESNWRPEPITDPVRTIATFLKASRQVIDDAPMLQTYLDRRLRHAVRNRLEQQVLKGNGTSPNIAGISQAGRHTAFTPATGDNRFDSINKAKYAVIGRDYDPRAVFINPADWGEMERLKAGASDERYVAGEGAALSYIQSGMTPLVWGLPVVASNNVEQGKFYVLDTSAITLFMRSGAVVEMFEQDEDNVQKNLITIRAELRAALAVFTPSAVSYGDLVIS